MSERGNLDELLRAIQGSKPGLLKSFQLNLEALARITRLDDARRSAALKITYAAEFVYFEADRLFALLVMRGELLAFADLAHAIGDLDFRYARVLIEAYPRLSFPLAFVDRDIRILAHSALALPGAGQTALKLCMECQNGELCRFMLGSLSTIALHSPGTMPECAKLIVALALKVAPGPLMRWISRGIDLMTSDRVDEGVRFLLLESKIARQMLGLNHAVLEDYRKILRIYVTSLTGRDLAINDQELSMFGLRRPYTDGASIFLPARLDFFKQTQLNERMLTVLAALQAGSLGMGSFSLDGKTLGFTTELRERYGTLLPEIMPNLRKVYAGLAQTIKERKDGAIEAVFPNKRSILLLETEHEKLFYSFPTPEFAKELFTLAENARIEAGLSALYPGLKEDCALLNVYLWKRRQGKILGGRAEFEGFFATLEALAQYSLLGRWGMEIGDRKALEAIHAMCDALNAVRAPGATVRESAKAMFAIYNIFFANFRLEAICARYAIADRLGNPGMPRFYPEIVREIRPELLKRDARAEFVPEEDPPEKAKAIDFSAFRDSRDDGDDMRKAVQAGSVKVFRYKEYDYLRGAYLQNKCTLFETGARRGPADYHSEVLRRHATVYKRTRKRFLAMKPEEMEISRRWYSGTEIDPTDSIDYCISLRRGESPDEKIYSRKILNRRDLTVAILLDASRSTEALVGGRSVIEIEKESLVILASALHAIEDSFGLFAFNSEGPGKVYLSVVKDFLEGWVSETWGRIASIKPYESNRDGCAIRHMSARLAERPEKTKLLLLLSDGIPADVDYGAQAGMSATKYAIEDTRRAIREAREMGIVPFCLNIDSKAKDYIAHLYGSYHYALLDDVARLPERLSQLYLRLTG